MSATDTALPASATARTRPRGTLLPRLGTFSLFALPGIALYLAFVLVPVVMSFVSSLTDENAMHPVTHFVGLSNYRQLLSDPSFHRSLGNTALLTAAVVVVPNAVGLGVALLLDRGSRLYRMLRTVFFTPVVLSSVVVSVIWQALLTDDGIINKVLRSLGAEHPPGWLSDPRSRWARSPSSCAGRCSASASSSTWPGCKESRPSSWRRRSSTARAPYGGSGTSPGPCSPPR